MSKYSLQDLGIAWRKAKADLFYSRAPSLSAVEKYEKYLYRNLRKLQKKLDDENERWFINEEFFGGWTLIPKSFPHDSKNEDTEKFDSDGLVFSSPAEEWVQTHCDGRKSVAEFRVMACCRMNFHVLSTLWMLKVGHLFEAQLPDCAYGNRLRRTKNDKRVNPLSVGTFQPYMRPFSKWRDNGIKAMRAALKDDQRIVAITGDVSKFYHKLDPSFMLDEAFVQEVFRQRPDKEDIEFFDKGHTHWWLHRLFIRALQAWAEATPLGKGLPVGLPAAHVVANMAMLAFDRMIEEQVMPIYYGRYVDDIILVVKNTGNFKSKKDVWDWLIKQSATEQQDKILAWDKQQKQTITFNSKFLGESEIKFSNDKNKVFLLSGQSGQALVDGIEHQIRERASEWRALPVLPKNADSVLRNLVVPVQGDGDAADNLRKADSLMLRRASFALRLRDYEACERDLPPAAWKDHRATFLDAVAEHVLTLPTFFDLAQYLPRILSLATACEDFERLRKLLDALDKLCKQLTSDCILKVAACDDGQQPAQDTIERKWAAQVRSSAADAIAAAFPARFTREGKDGWRTYMTKWSADHEFRSLFVKPNVVAELKAQQNEFFSLDLAHTPFRAIGLPQDMVPQRGIPAKKAIIACKIKDACKLLRKKDTGEKSEEEGHHLLDGVARLADWVKLRDIPMGFLFPTRPFSLTELYLLEIDVCAPHNQESLTQIVSAIRGFKLTEQRPRFDGKGVLQVAVDEPTLQPTVTVSSWQTSDASWAASVKRMDDPDADRYARLCRLVNRVIQNPKKSHYLVLPELAIPARWFMRIAHKLQRRGTSLITGIEYLHPGKHRVRNQIWAGLVHDALGFPSLMVYRQDKQFPALHEERELLRVGGCTLQIPNTAKWELQFIDEKKTRRREGPPVIQHGDLRFALLVCSELTNIRYRAALRGQIDALFVPEWNQDTDTFDALVESAALDIHAYIIQCNVRQYGDSRIRAPSKDSWRRDVLRVKGGESDYCVMGKIDAQALRRFQSSHRSPDKPFKPVPDGFEIAYERRLLPAGEME